MIDWTALGDETVDLLRRYLMIDTTNPPGNEIAGARFLADVLHGTTADRVRHLVAVPVLLLRAKD